MLVNFKGKFLLVITLFFVAIGLLGYSYSTGIFPTASEKMTSSERVRSQNVYFQKGYNSLISGDYANAKKFFESSLDAVENEIQEAYVRYYIAVVTGLGGDYQDSIRRLKYIAENQNYSDSQRAYAISFMGELYFRSGQNETLTDLIFNSSPYDKFLDKDDIYNSYTKLFEYAVSFYPVPEAIYHTTLAKFYEVAPIISKDYQTSAEKTRVGAFWEDLNRALISIEDQLVFLQRVKASQTSVSESYLQKANILSMATILGKDRTSEAEDSFSKALTMSSFAPEQKLKVSYYYALFLAQRYGLDRLEDIKKHLSLFDTPEYQIGVFYDFLLSDAARKNQRVRISVKILVSKDTDFGKLIKVSEWNL